MNNYQVDILTFEVTRRSEDRVWFRFIKAHPASEPLEVKRCPKHLMDRMKTGCYYAAEKRDVKNLEGIVTWQWLDVIELDSREHCLAVAEAAHQDALPVKNIKTTYYPTAQKAQQLLEF